MKRFACLALLLGACAGVRSCIFVEPFCRDPACFRDGSVE